MIRTNEIDAETYCDYAMKSGVAKVSLFLSMIAYVVFG